MLGKVAKLDALRQTNIATYRRKLARQQLNQGRFTGAVAPEQTDTGTRHQVEFDGIQDDALAIARADFFHFQQGVGEAFRRAEAKVERVVDVRRGDHLHAFQHLNAALGLFGF